MIPHEGTPAEESVPPEWRKKIVHARLVSNGMVLMGSDAPPDRYQPMKGFSVRSLFDHFTTNEAFPLTSPERTPSSALGTSRGVPRREWR